VDVSALRAQFPVLGRVAYLNAGTDGPLPGAAAQAAAEELEREAREGRTLAHFPRRGELTGALRGAYAQLLGCTTENLSLTTCTSEGLALVLDGLRLGADDEILTSDEEHPGLLGSLIAARELRGVQVRAVPWPQLPGAVGARTRLIACSHVSWMSGSIAPAALAEVDVPVLLDGAQGVGAIPTDVRALRCAAYAGPGQKWLCGPDGTGMLYTTPELRERLAVTRRGYANLADPGAGLQAVLHADARRLDTLSLNAETVACALAAFRVLERVGWETLHARARALAATLVERLTAIGREVVAQRSSLPTPAGAGDPAPAGNPPLAGDRDRAPAGAGGASASAGVHSTLIAFLSPDPPAERERLAAAGVALRDIPGRPWLRASVGAWNDEGDIERLIDVLRE
jgi:selenocysteine lyase/cysteine desulfurase